MNVRMLVLSEQLAVVKRIYANGSTIREAKFDRWLAQHDADLLRSVANDLDDADTWQVRAVSPWLRERATRLCMSKEAGNE